MTAPREMGFDWTALQGWVQIITLLFLGYQIKLTRDQVQVSKEELALARNEVAEANQRAEEARHEAARPDLVLEQHSATVRGNRESGEVTYIIRNVDVGTAYNVTLTVGNGETGDEHTYSVASITPGAFDKAQVHLSTAEAPLRLTFYSRYRRKFEKSFTVEIPASNHLHTYDSDGSLVAKAPVYLANL